MFFRRTWRVRVSLTWPVWFSLGWINVCFEIGGKLWKNPTFYRENSRQLQTEFCLNVPTRIWSKKNESCMQRNCIAMVRPRVAFSALWETEAASAQQDVEDPQFADPCDRSCHSTCCDYCASKGNVTELEEPDQNLPAQGSHESLGACSTGEAAQEGVYSWWRIRGGRAGSHYFSDASSTLWCSKCQLWAAQAQDNCMEVFVVAEDWWGAQDPGIIPLSQCPAPVGWSTSGRLALKSFQGGPHPPSLATRKLYSPSMYKPHTIASVKTSAFPIISQLFL